MVPTLERLEARTLPSFLPASSYRASLLPATVAVGDLNGDGLLDVVMADRYGYGGPVLVWLGNGDGTLRTPPTTVFFGSFQNGLVLGDFNRDGRPDLAVTTSNHPDTGRGRGVHVLLGRGDGSFEPARSLDPGGDPRALAVGDFNSDDQLDLAVTISYTGRTVVRVLLGHGDGSFEQLPIHDLDRFSRFAAVGDFNADGQLDLVGASPETFPGVRGDVRVLLGNGDGTFRVPVPYEAGRNPNSVVVDDFNADGHEDLAVANYATFPQDDGSVSVLLGNGDGTFQEAQHYPTGRESRALAVGDFNRDCLPDLAAGYLSAGDTFVVGLFLGRGEGSFWEEGTYPTGRGPASLAVGDFDDDEYPDLAMAGTGLEGFDVALARNAADWVQHRDAPCAVSPRPAPGASSDRWAAVVAALTIPAGPTAALCGSLYCEQACRLPDASAALLREESRPVVPSGPLAAPAQAEALPPPLLDRLFAGLFDRGVGGPLGDVPLRAEV